MWNVSIETETELTDAGAERAVDALEGFHPVAYRGDFGGLAVTISLEAESARHAAAVADALLASAELEVRTLKVMTTDDYDAGGDWQELMSVSDAAAELGVSRQAILSRISAGSLPARQVGTAWVISRTGLLPRGQRRTRRAWDQADDAGEVKI